MFVKNNTLSMHRISLSGNFGHHIDLFPGVNTVAESDWVEALKNPMVKGRIERNEYEPLAKTAPITPALVKETYNPALLDEFDKSKNKKVKVAVAAQKSRLELTDAEKAGAKGRPVS